MHTTLPCKAGILLVFFGILSIATDEPIQIPESITILVNKCSYAYSPYPFVLTRALGFARALLKEYNITGADAETYKLYKTTAPNWYDVANANPAADKSLLGLLKLEIDYLDKVAP